MQTNLVTRHAVRNYGSALQTIATCELLANAGASPRVVDYRQPGHEDSGWAIANQGAGARLPVPARLAYAALRHPGARRTGRVFDEGLRGRVELSSRIYRSFEELEGATEFDAEDLFCVGSDQVWNIHYNVDNRPYYLDFAPTTARKFSLSSSLGAGSLPRGEEGRLVEALQAFAGVSVREADGAEYLNGLGVPAVQHVDPVLAVGTQFWKNFAGAGRAYKPYLLVYQLNSSEVVPEVAGQIARALGLEIKRVEYWRGPRSFKGSSVVRPTLNQFVRLFRDASFVVTDSFHGTAFSSTFTKPYVAVAPPKYGTRISSLLELTSQQERLVGTPSAALDVALNGPDQSGTAAILRSESVRSQEYVRAMVG